MEIQAPDLKKFSETWRSGDLMEYVSDLLEKYVKRDSVTKLSVFFTGLSAYLDEPLNLFLKGESGIGKTYNAVQSLRHFPQSSVWYLGGMSPKALIHQYGIQLTKDGQPLENVLLPEKPNRRDYTDLNEYKKALTEYKNELKSYREIVGESYTLIDLSGKILVFLEAPDGEAYRMILPILSHDKHEIEYKFVDKDAKGKLKTSMVVIRGWPASVFLTTDRSYLEELSTRSFTATPDASKEKISAVNEYTNMRMSYPWENMEDERDECLKWLLKNLKAIREMSSVDVVIPFPNLHELFPKEIVRDMRDFSHFCQFIKPIALLHYFQRPKFEIAKDGTKKTIVVATGNDVMRAIKLYSSIFETTRTGTEQKILNFYHMVVKTRAAWHVRELVDAWNNITQKKVSRDWVEKALKRLMAIGYVDSEPDQMDKRMQIYRVLQKEENPEINRLTSDRKSFMEVLSKGAKIWLEKISDKIPPPYIEKKNSDELKKVQLTTDELFTILTTLDEKIFIHPDENSSDIFKMPKISDKPISGEFSSDKERNGENRTVQEKENCGWCSNYAIDFSICTLNGERVDAQFSCSKFQPILWRCSCGAGPWKSYGIAKEHAKLMGMGHEITKV